MNTIGGGSKRVMGSNVKYSKKVGASGWFSQLSNRLLVLAQVMILGW